MRPSRLPLLPLLLVTLLTACGDDDAARARREIREAGEVTADYLRKKTQEWSNRLSTLDDEIASAADSARQRAAGLGADAEQRWQTLKQNLDARREAFNQKLAAMKAAGADDLDEAGAAVEKAWAELKQAVQEMKEAAKGP